jgi:hypothetical protein
VVSGIKINSQYEGHRKYKIYLKFKPFLNAINNDIQPLSVQPDFGNKFWGFPQMP